MKFWKLAAITSILFFSTSINAALIDNGGYTTDDVNNLDWLDLSYTSETSYSNAESYVNDVLGGGWQYATVPQMEQMWFQAFGSIVMRPDTPLSTTAYSVEVDNFISLFGNTQTVAATYTQSIGLYEANGHLRITGVKSPNEATLNDSLWSPDFYYEYDSLRNSVDEGTGTYLVRTTVVPVPAAVWLFGSGLIGLIGVARRKKA